MPEIILCGAEGEQFLFENTLTTFGADDKRRGSVSVNAGEQMYRSFTSSYTDFWVHFRVAPFDVETGTTFNDSLSGTLMEIGASGTTLARMSSIAEDGRLQNATVFFTLDAATNSAGSMDTGNTVPHGTQEFVNYDIRIQITTVTDPDDTLTVTFYRNEVLRRTVTYTDAAGFPRPNEVTFNPRVSARPGQDDTRYQDIIVTDALPTVGMELATLVPSAVGNFSEFTNDYTAIDDEGYDQSTTISTTAAAQRESWFFADPEFNLGDKVIYGVAITSVAQLDLAGNISDFQPFVRIGGINYDQAGIGANNVAPNAYVTLIEQNPSTVAPWGKDELVGLETGILSA